MEHHTNDHVKHINERIQRVLHTRKAFDAHKVQLTKEATDKLISSFEKKIAKTHSVE